MATGGGYLAVQRDDTREIEARMRAVEVGLARVETEIRHLRREGR